MSHLRLRYVELLRLAGRWDALVEIEPGDEQAHVALMQQHLAAGDRHAVLRQFERMDRELSRELGVRPGPAAIALRDQALAGAPVRRSDEELVGRDAEQAALGRTLAEAAAGRGRALFVTGSPGIGKSTLLARARQLAAEQGFRVGQGAAASVEGSWPYAPVLEALADVCRRHVALLDGLDDSYRVEIDRALSGGEVAWSGDRGHQRLFVAAAELVRLAASGQGLLLTIDDVHDADEASLRLLHYLARATSNERVALVVSHRLDPVGPALLEVRQSLVARQGAVVAELAPLDEGAMAGLIGRYVAEPDQELVEQIAAISGGVPFAVAELARRAASEPAWVQMLDATMVGGIDPLTREVLQRVAVVGTTFDTDQFVALSGLPDAEAFAHLDRALAARIVEHTTSAYQFRHGLVRDALLEDLAPHRQRRVHRDAADRLAELGAPPARIGYHLLHADEPAAAVPYLLKAAAAAAAMGAYRDALDLVDSVQAHASGDDRVALLALRADLLMAIGDPTALTAYREALAVADPVLQHTLRARLARAAVMSGDLDTAEATLEGLEPNGGPADAEILLARGHLAFLRSDFETAWAVAEEAQRRVLAGDRSWQVLDLASLQGLLAHHRGEWFDRMLMALRRTRDHPEIANAVFDGHLCAAEYVLYGPTPYREVIAIADSLRATAQRSGALRAVAFASALIGEASLLSGDLERAAVELQEAIDLHHDLGSATGEAHSLQRLAEVRLAEGDRDEANRLLQRALPLARWSMLAMHVLQRVYGTMVLAAPDAAAARAMVDRAESTLGVEDNCAFCSIMLAVPATMACAAVGDLENAHRHLAVAEQSADLWAGTAWEAALLEAQASVAVAEGQVPAAGRLLIEAAERFTQAGQPVDAERCQLAAAAAGA